MTVTKPRYPVAELATWELRDYRQELERAVATLPETAPLRQIYDGRLTEVISEQEARSVTTGIPAAWAGADGDD
jgi:hypothetical protein